MEHALELTSRAEATHFWFRGFRKFITPVLDRIAGGRGNLRLLDCGCGNGWNLALLRRHGEVFGFDLTAGALTRARASGRPLVRADVRHIPFRDAMFDVATSFDVLQSIEDDRRAVGEMARVLRPGGRLVLTVAALEALRGDHSEVWREVRRYTPASARALVAAAGLRVERVSFLFASLFPVLLAVRTSQRLLRPYRPASVDSDIRVPAAPVNAVLTWLVSGEAALARRLPLPIGSSLLVVARKA